MSIFPSASLAPPRSQFSRWRWKCSWLALFAYPLTISRAQNTPRNDSYGFKDPRLVYSPRQNWHLGDPDTHLAYTNLTGANVTTSFFGSAIYLSSSRKADQYLLKVVIDGHDHYDINLNGPAMDNPPEEVLWGVKLVQGNHTFLAYHPGADPLRPYVSLAALTITTGQPLNGAPPIASTPLNQNDDHAIKRLSILPRVLAALCSLIGLVVFIFLGVRYQRRRNVDKINRYMQQRQARYNHKLAHVAPGLVERAPLESHRYFPIQTLSRSHPATLSHQPMMSPLSIDGANELDPLSATKPEPEPEPEPENESEFWRSRPAPDRLTSSTEDILSNASSRPHQDKIHLDERGQRLFRSGPQVDQRPFAA